MIERPLDEITVADIERLVMYARTEGLTLDFKEVFPDAGHKGTRDFLADVTAFANTDGGDIVMGIREDGNGSAAEIVGMLAEGLDEALRRVDDQLRACVDPRVPYFRVRSIPIGAGSVVLVMRVGASLIAPHRVTFDKSSRFFRRGNRSNYEMSTAELRQAFAATNDLPGRIRDLHRRAIDATGGAGMPTHLQELPTAILTVAPLSVLREPRDINITREQAVLPPLIMDGVEMVVGLEGRIVYRAVDRATNATSTWSVNHRRGYLDFAWTIGRVNDGRSLVYHKNFDEQMPAMAQATVARLREFGIEGPWIAMVTVRRVKDFRIVAGNGYATSACWVDEAFLGEVLSDTMGPGELNPLIEAFWRLFGVDQPPLEAR